MNKRNVYEYPVTKFDSKSPITSLVINWVVKNHLELNDWEHSFEKIARGPNDNP